MRSSSVNSPSRSSGSSHWNDASLICALFGTRGSVFSATWLIVYLPDGAISQLAPSLGGRLGSGKRPPLPRRQPSAIYTLNAPVAQLDRALPSEGRGQGFESLRARQL